MILQIQQGLLGDDLKIGIEKLCRWFEVTRKRSTTNPQKHRPSSMRCTAHQSRP